MAVVNLWWGHTYKYLDTFAIHLHVIPFHVSDTPIGSRLTTDLRLVVIRHVGPLGIWNLEFPSPKSNQWKTEDRRL